MQRPARIVGTIGVILGILTTPALAQHTTVGETISHDAFISAQAVAPVVAPAAETVRVSEQRARPASRRVLVPLYISTAALQMMDVHSTRRAIARGHVEGNPLMSGIASNTTAFVAVKAATAASVILVSERLRKRNRAAAIGVMIALNAATAAVVAHNYRVGR